MGKMSTKVVRVFERELRQKILDSDKLATIDYHSILGMSTVELKQRMLEEGIACQHNFYVEMLNLAQLFLEAVLGLAAFRQVNNFIAKWQDIYDPSYPPFSPITLSCFNTWSMFDVTFGSDKETLGGCFLAIASQLSLNEIYLQIARNLDKSRLGIYLVLGGDGRSVNLCELVTNRVIVADCVSGYKAVPGDLLLVRLVPQVLAQSTRYVMLTTPYQLIRQKPQEWLQYFARHAIIPDQMSSEEKLYRHMKYGKNPMYWIEFIFYGYCNYREEVIFMTGFPDQTHTQPAHNDYQKKLR